jgi:hypothetical protein
MNSDSKKIIRWNADNPPEVECAFRKGFLLGAHLASSTKSSDVVGLYIAFINVTQAIEQYTDSWDNVYAAHVRGIGHGIRAIVEWYADKGSPAGVHRWLIVVNEWAYQPFYSRDYAKASPPEIGAWTWNQLVRHWQASQKQKEGHQK